MTQPISNFLAPSPSLGMRLGSVIRPLLWATLATAFAVLPVGLSAQAPAPPAVSAERTAKDGSVWGALVFASNTKQASTNTPAPEDFPNLAERLGKVFPYTNFEVLGQHSQVVFREYESWVVPSKDVFLKLDSKGAAPKGGLNLHVQFWQGQQVLVKTDTLLQPNSPLFIGGPKWRDGQLIFVLLLKKVEAAK